MEGRDWVAILDFGSQYTHLIARRVRELGAYSEILPFNTKASRLLPQKPKAIILSGGPASVTGKKSPVCSKAIFDLDIPVLGVCYGHQVIAKLLGGRVAKSLAREYGKANLRIKSKRSIFKGLGNEEVVWMSHADKVTKLPPGFSIIAQTANANIAAMEHRQRRLYGVQFHPEVVHTHGGKKILRNFLINIAKCKPTWNIQSFIDDSIKSLRQNIGKERVLCALSGGVDSSVLAVLLHKAVGKNLVCIFIDNGLLRKGERSIVEKRFRNNYHINLRTVRAEDIFLKGLKGVVDPEKKRKIIGKLFIRVFEKEAKKLGLSRRTPKGSIRGKIKFLAQGTLYPDVIESKSAWGGPSATIKTHHNVGGLPRRFNFQLVEPLKYLFKDEVRVLGKKLGLPDDIVYRQPFPGPGLAVRVVGQVSKQRLHILRQADWILTEEMKKDGFYKKLWQSFCVFIPIKTVGVMGDERTYENAVAIRAVESSDAMTAHWARLPYSLLERISSRIINEVEGVNRVVYDISSKPPSTIEWE